jgi:integrase
MKDSDAKADKPKMKASIIKRGNSYAGAVYVGKDDDGKKQYRWVSSLSQHEVKLKMTALRHERDTGGMFASTKGTVGEFIERWLKEYATPNLSPRTTEEYRSIYRSGIGPAMGSVPLRNLKPDRIQQYYADKLAGGRSTTTVRHHAMMLHRVLEHAVKWQLLPRNPADAATPPGTRYVEMHTLDGEQTAAFLEAAKETPYFTEFHVALFTGMRRSEIMALRWQDVDLLMAEISVSRSMHQMNKPRRVIFRGTKTDKSARKVAMAPETCDVLRHHLANDMALCARLGLPFTNDRLLFCEYDPKALLWNPLSPDRVSRAWDRLIRDLKLPHVRFHDARHTHASLLLKADVHPKVVQERLGHANVQTTLNIYSHVAPGMQRRAAEAFGAMVAPRISRGLAEPQNVGGETTQESHDLASKVVPKVGLEPTRRFPFNSF